MHRATRNELARVLHQYSVHDPYLLVFGPDNPDAPGQYVLRVVLAVPEDKATDHQWTANSLQQVRGMLPPGLVLWPRLRTTPLPGLLEQWCLKR
jgi:hypothetical protein